MKKALSLLLSLVFVLLLYAHASADHAIEINTLDLTGTNFYESASSLCWINNDLYVLGAYGIYHWTEGMETPETFCDLSASSAYLYTEHPPEDEERAQAWNRTVRHLFTNGETLFGLHPYSGQVFEITQESMRPVAQLPNDLLKSGTEDASFFREVKSAVCADERLFLLLGTDAYEKHAETELFSFDLTDQSLTNCSPTDAQGVAAGAEGKLILFIQGEENAFWQYDIASDMLDAQLATLQPEENPSGLAWYAKKDALAFFAANRVVLTDLSGTTQIKAYLPVSFANTTTPAACSQNGIYAYPYSNYVFLRDISIEGEASQTVLNLLGALSPSLIVNFSIENPDIAIVTTEAGTGGNLKRAIISADESVDLFVASAPGDFAAMKKKGFAAPLDDEGKLVEMAKQLYPTLQEVVFEDENLLAYPVTMQPYSWTVNESRWQALGLGEYPTTYDQLFHAIAIWLDEYAEDNPNDTLSDIQQSSIDMLVSMIVREYIFQNETSDERLTFNTPAFCALMTSVCDNAYLLSEENEQWGMALLSSYYQGFGCSYNDDDMVRMLLPPTLDEQKMQMLNASVEVLFVNAASRQQEAAARFVSFCAQNLDVSTQYMLNPGMNDPYPNPVYESRMETLNAELAALQSRLEDAEDSQVAILRDQITQKERMIESVVESRWMISPESIAVYRAVAENLRVPFDSAYLVEGENGDYNAIAAVIAQYCSDGLEVAEIDAFIKDLNRVTYLVYMEGQ